MTETSGILDLFGAGDICLADRGFNIQDLLLSHGCKLVIPPFTQQGKQFTTQKAVKTKLVCIQLILLMCSAQVKQSIFMLI